MTQYNCAPSLKKKIKIPTRKDLMVIMEDFINELKNKFIPVDEMIDQLAYYVSQHYRVNVSHAQSMKCPSNSMIISGEYDSDADEIGQVPISLVFITHTVDRVLVWDDDEFQFVSKQIADTLIHELVHLKQSRIRNFEPVVLSTDIFASEEEINRLYLEHDDEVEAYAYNIASELSDDDNQENIKKYLNCPSLTPIEASINLWNYMQVFEKDLKNPVLRRLMKKVYKHYINLKK